MTLYLDGETLTIEDIKSFLQQQSKVEIIDDVLLKMRKRFTVLLQVLDYLVMYV